IEPRQTLHTLLPYFLEVGNHDYR
ncbi:hypothetical protein D031_1456B, partial [Vibrio parahaemolyticus VP-48]